MTGRPSRIGLVCVLLSAIACGAEPRTTLFTERLGPEAFGLTAEGRGPVATIGLESRPVLEAPREEILLEARGVRVQDGIARVPLELPASSLKALESPRSLAVRVRFLDLWAGQVQPGAANRTQELLANWKELTSGWRVVAPEAEPGPPLLELTALDENVPRRIAEGDLHRVGIRLIRRRPGSPALTSRPFDLPHDAELAVAYGLVLEAENQTVRFRADLDCDGSSTNRTLVDDRISPSPLAWREATAEVPASTRCVLQLGATRPDGEAVHGAVWAVPRIRSGERPASDTVPPNLLMISLDTLRADHLSGYGYPRDTSPNIDARLIAQGVAFEDVSATYPMTDISHLSIFSGLYPATQPVRGRVSARSGVVLLAERLRDAGYETAAFAEDALLAGSLGFWFGFDRFVERPFHGAERGAPTVDDAVDYLERLDARGRFFLFVHTYKTHAPYEPSAAFASLWSDDGGRSPSEYVTREQIEERDQYDRTIREADGLVANLLTALAEAGLDADTHVVLLSDHGEAFGEHGLVRHGTGLQQEQLRVPLIIRGPGLPAGLRIESPVSLVDVFPTVLELLNLPPPALCDGVSLARLWRQPGTQPPERPVFFEAAGQAGVRMGHWKYWRRKQRGALFDLQNDPAERQPVENGGVTERARELLELRAAESERRRTAIADAEGTAEAPPVTEAVQDALRALGYVD